MKWRNKAKIQSSVALLPSSISYPVYYWLQRNFGSLRSVNPLSRLRAGFGTVARLKDCGFSSIDKVFLEIGTGRRINTPLSFYLMGAREILTVDLNPYLKEELIRDDIAFILNNEGSVKEVLGDFLLEERLEKLFEFVRAEPNYSLQDLLRFCCITYSAPADATSLPFANKSIDFHTSYTVFEHIPPSVLKKILLEGNRVIRTDGAFIHRIDYSDHFSHSDKSISPANFLKFSTTEWDKIAGNRYMYMNRLRHDEFLDMFKSVNHSILLDEPSLDRELLQVIEQGKLDLHDDFRGKSSEIIATTGAWLVSSLQSHSPSV